MLRETVLIVAQTGDETTGIRSVASLYLDALVRTEYVNQLDGDSDVGGGSLHLGSTRGHQSARNSIRQYHVPASPG